MTRYVRSKYSEQAKVWEVSVEYDDCWRCDGDSHSYYLPKFDYEPCAPPARDVTGELTGSRYKTILFHDNLLVAELTDDASNHGYRFSLDNGALKMVKG
jgi:hypothetical protein